MYSRTAIDVGLVDPDNITAIQNDLMLDYVSEQSAANGAVLMPVGEYKRYFRGLNYVFRLNHPVRYCGVLNPEAILPAQQEGLKALLVKASKDKALAAGEYIVPVTIDGNRELHFCELQSTVSARKKFADVDYYDVLDDSAKSLLGGGSFGQVYIVPGTIKPRFFNPNDMFFSPGNQKRIAKLQYHSHRRVNKHKKPYAKLTRAKREAELLRRSSSSRARDLNILHMEDEALSIISMHRYEGNDLSDVLSYEMSVRDILECQLKLQGITNKLQRCKGDPASLLTEYTSSLNSLCEKIDDWSRRRSMLHPDLRAGLTVKDRIELSISLLREYQFEVQNNHILHRDLKLENIYLERDGMKLQPHIIDFGLSCDQSSHSQLHKTVGALLFRAPEAIDGPNTVKSDVYALMRVIALIWCDQELFSNEAPGNTRISFNKKRKNETVINFDLFAGLEINQELKKMIEKVIRCGTLWNPSQRYDIHADIDAFEAVRVSFYMDSVVPDVHREIADAHRKALMLVDEMAANSGFQSLDGMAKNIIKISGTLSHHPQAIDIFVRTLGMRTLYACHSLPEITDTVYQIQSRYQSAHAEYASLLTVLRHEAAQFGIVSYQKYLDQCQILLDELSSKATTIDTASDITNHLVGKLMKMNEASRYYQNIMDGKEIKTSPHRIAK